MHLKIVEHLKYLQSNLHSTLDFRDLSLVLIKIYLELSKSQGEKGVGEIEQRLSLDFSSYFLTSGSSEGKKLVQ